MTTPDNPSPISPPERRAEGLTLREHRLEDADAVLERCLDPDAQRFTTIPRGYTRDMAVHYVTEVTAPAADRIDWAIELDGRYAGSIDLRTFGKGFSYGAGSLGFITSPWARRRGVMTTAVALVLDEAFTRGLDVITWDAHVGNLGSWRSVWRNGFHSLTFVPQLLAGKDGLEDAWHAIIRRDDDREPQRSWRDAVRASGTPDVEAHLG